MSRCPSCQGHASVLHRALDQAGLRTMICEECNDEWDEIT